MKMLPCLILSLIVSSASAQIENIGKKPSSDSKNETNLEKAWQALSSTSPEETTEAILLMAKSPKETIPFLESRLSPLRMDERLFETTFEKLASDEKKEVEKAFETFSYLDPRLMMGLEDLMKKADKAPTRQRMVELLSNRKIFSLKGQDISLRRINPGEDPPNYNFSSGGRSWWVEATVKRFNTYAYFQKPSWSRAVRAIKILESFDDPAADKIIAKVATGERDALLTKIARKISFAKKKAK